MIKQWWGHVSADLFDAGFHLRCAIKSALAPIFGKRRYSNAIEWRGTIYRYDPKTPQKVQRVPK